MSDIATKLDEARALIEKGWCQRAYALGRRYCARAALNMVFSGSPYRSSPKTRKQFHRPLERVIGAPIEVWNDAPERTQTEVIEAFKKAADLARAEA